MRLLEVLKVLEQLAPGSAYLVGGCVRDILLNKKFNDIDLVVKGSASQIAGCLAEKTGAKSVLLDREHDVMRVITSEEHIDITGLKDKTLNDNLKSRDFTINAVALPLKSYLDEDDFIKKAVDPLGGIEDLFRGIIRACSASAFKEDPVRVLRAVRFQAGMEFKIAQDTLRLMRNLKAPFSAVAGERVWEELRFILNLDYSHEVIRFLDNETNFLEDYFPEITQMRQMEQNHYHTDNVWEHSLKALYYFEYFLNENIINENAKEEVIKYLNLLITRERKRLPTVKLACLFHDVGKLKTRGERSDGRITFYNHHKAGVSEVKKIGNRLKLSNKELYLLQGLVEWHMQPLFLYKETPLSNKAISRFFRNLNIDVPGCLILSLADITSSRISTNHIVLAREYYYYIEDLLKKYYKYKNEVLNIKPLLTGKEICKVCNISPSPLVGELKDNLIEAQIEGRITNRREAEKLLLGIINKHSGQE